MISRADKGAVANWWWTVDRWLLFAIICLLVLGITFSFSASPALAIKQAKDKFFYVERHAIFAFLSVIILFTCSFLSPRMVRRSALILFIMAFSGLILTFFIGTEIKGARRWISIAGQSVQASEFIKPAVIVLCAWAFAQSIKNVKMPAIQLSIFIYGITVTMLLLQPDFGQTILISLSWAALFFFSGVSLWLVWLLGLIGVFAIVMAYFSFHHVQERFDRFFDKSSGDTFQIDKAHEAISSGGLFGKGIGEGTVKRILPDSHTDFIFAVIAEEFGLILCMFVVGLFAFIVLRSLICAMRAHDPFIKLSVAGLAILFGLQAFINIAVNIQLAPAKGMTLPFISYGGSSMISVAITLGFLLAVTRKQLISGHA